MTASSPRGGRIDVPTDALGANRALDAFIVRDVIANNALHSADESAAHVLVNWINPINTLITGNPTLTFDDFAAFGSDNYYTMYSVQFPFPVRANGSGYAVRVRLYGACSGVGPTCTFRVSVRGVGESTFGYAEFATTSTTPAWLTATPSDVISVPRGVCESSMVPFNTLHDTGGDSVTTDICMPWLIVEGKSTASATGVCRLSGLHVAAYGGA